jgi:hypothetical protein
MTIDEATRERYRVGLAAQVSFARGYSPLYASMCERLAAWLDDGPGSAQRLGVEGSILAEIDARVGAYLSRIDSVSELTPVLRLGSALHAYVLEADPRVAALRPYYATVTHDVETRRLPTDPRFEVDLLAAFRALDGELFERAASWRVQTNETSRGLVWLLPAVLVGAEATYLVELGASAGLNLYAEHRAYDLVDPTGKVVRLGRAASSEFEVRLSAPLPSIPADARPGPDVLGRVGCDIHPIDLSSPESEHVLEAVIWGDQPGRLARLREGIDVHRRARAGEIRPTAEVRYANLPEDVEGFLARAVPERPVAPVICFNAYVTTYLPDVDHRALQRKVSAFAHAWSLQHRLPWMWIRFEPTREGQPPPPHPGWCRWRVEVWLGSEHRTIDLGWAHPHLVQAELGAGVDELVALGSR